VALSEQHVNKIAHLARLAIPQEAMSEYTQNLSNILGLVEQMQKVDTADILPMAHPLDSVQRLREDKVSEIDQHALFQQNAPQVEAGLYLVPKVIE